ncbi:hypothetical protein ES703_55039 [subsurface metagenome]
MGPRVWEVVNGRWGWFHGFGLQLPREKWCNIEITWWNYPPYDGKHPLAIQFRAYYDHNWHDYGRAENENARWHNSAINRVGFWPFYNDNYFDDTEIHAPVWPPPGAKLIYTSIYTAGFTPVPHDTWLEWDISTLIPSDATVIEVACSAFVNNTVGCRPLGSDLGRLFLVGVLPDGTTSTIQCEVGADRKIEVYRQANTDVWFAIIGYWTPQ